MVKKLLVAFTEFVTSERGLDRFDLYKIVNTI